MRVRAVDRREDESQEDHEQRLDGVRKARAKHPNPVIKIGSRSITVQRGAAARCNIDTFDVEGIEQSDVGEMDLECYYCRALGWRMENRGTSAKPHFGVLCCNTGRAILEHTPEPPQFFKDLYMSQLPRNKYFRANARKFNSGMAMASLQIERDRTPNPPSALRIQGTLMRRIGPLMSDGRFPPSCLQTYFFDPDEQVRLRIGRLDKVNKHDGPLFRGMHEGLLDCGNTYLQSFLSVQEYVETLPYPPPNFNISIHADVRPGGDHRGRYNLPGCSEISVLMPEEVERKCKRRIVLSYREDPDEQNLRILDDTHRSYDPLQYPLLFPYGTDGWDINLRGDDDKKVTLKQWISYHLMDRRDHFNPVHHANKLGQQWIVDMYCKMELARLKFVRLNQKKLRADLYGGLVDNLIQDVDLTNTGRPIILPSTVVASPRYMHQKFCDAMAIVDKNKKPHLFITMTSNPKWPEVVSQLKKGQIAQDRPDILNRVFQMKKKELLALIENGVYFGVKARVHSIEFQKRGCPHAHLAVWFDHETFTPAEIDGMICAEIPPEGHPLRHYVISLMMHGPCGELGKTSPCMKDSKCTKKFPKEYVKETRHGEDAFAKYRRRSPDDGGHTCQKRSKALNAMVTMDNGQVVPYSPYFLYKFNCHINIEFCATLKSVKYLFKYNLKGGDKATITFENEERDDAVCRNEILQFQNRRYVSSPEAAWRIFGFEVCSLKPSILRLPVHLPDQQTVLYNPEEPEEAQKAVDNGEKTMLTEYFTANQMHENARSCYYRDFPEQFVWNVGRKEWTPRIRLNSEKPSTIGRLISIHPNRGESFYMRTLLLHRMGKVSFEDLRTVENILHPTFKAACIALDLLESDVIWRESLAEAVAMASPKTCRYLFICIIVQCTPSDPGALYREFCDFLKEDFLYLHDPKHDDCGPSPEAELAATNDLLSAIQLLLDEHGKTNSDFDIPDALQPAHVDIEFGNEIDLNAQKYFENHIDTLNEDQLSIFDRLTGLIDEDEGGFFFIDAPGGTGKTYLINLLLAYVRKQEKIAIATASSGIAGTLLTKGTTAHNRFKFPIPIFSDDTCTIKMDSRQAKFIKKSVIIFIDEISMLHHHNVGALDRWLQELMDNKLLFGGKLVVICGDFRQILPVIPRGNRADIVRANLKSSHLWKYCTTLRLTTNMRIQRMIDRNPTDDNRERLNNFGDWLLSIGNGTIETVEDNIIEIPEQMACPTPQDLYNQVYDNFEDNLNSVEYFRSRGILASKNETVDQINEELLERIPGKEFVFEGIDTVMDERDQGRIQPEILNNINCSGLPQHSLKLKVGAIILLMRNLDVSNGHCNGSRYRIMNITPRLIQARPLSSNNPNDFFFIPRIPICTKENEFPWIIKRLQFPVRLAFAITFNRSQGQSLNKVGLLLPESLWTHGQLYVGVSRCGDPNNIFIFADQASFSHLPDTSVYTRNIIFPEVL